MSDNFTPEQEDVLRKAEKLMRLAAKNPNEAEAASAMNKALALLAQYNLSTAALEASGASDSGKRAEEKVVGGFYEFEQDLWRAIAELNFCWYWNQLKFIPYDERKKHRGRTWTHQHVLIGRTVNIASTKAMAGYLMQAVERLTKEQITDRGLHPRSSWAVSFRRGVAERVQEKVEDRRGQILEEERVKARKAREATASGASTSTALTLSSVIATEHEANYDFVYGEGAYAKAQEDRRARAKAAREAEEAYTKWAAENPEEAAKEAEEERKRQERNAKRRRGRSWSAPAFKGDWSAYAMGREKGADIGIDQQAEARSQRRIA